MSSKLAERWRSDLEAWAIPQPLMEAVAESPYARPPPRAEQVRQAAAQAASGPTVARVIDLAGGGSVLDVGAGTGRNALPLVEAGLEVSAVESDRTMVEALRGLAARCPIAVVEGSWPAVADRVEAHTVALAANVVYDVGDIAPFLSALHRVALRGVVLECTERHPWSALRPLFAALHGIVFPDAPTVDDLVGVITEVIGTAARRQRWSAPGGPAFADRDQLLAFYRRRLVLPESRLGELEALIGERIREVDGRFTAATGERPMATLWWRI